LLVVDRVIGVLTALFHSPSRFDNQQTDVLKLLVAQVAPAVAAAQLSALRTSLYEREQLLRDMSRSLASDVDQTHVLDLAVRSVAELVGAPFARIWLVQPDGSLRCAAAEGYDTNELGLTLPIETLPG